LMNVEWKNSVVLFTCRSISNWKSAIVNF